MHSPMLMKVLLMYRSNYSVVPAQSLQSPPAWLLHRPFSRTFAGWPWPKGILHFGTSRFLQAHVDFFVHEARQTGQDIRPITIVKTTAGGARDGRVEALGDEKGFPVHFRGHENGRIVDETVMVKSVVRAMDANKDWHGLAQLFTSETDIVVSYVGAGGYDFPAEDRFIAPLPTLSRNFPAQLLRFSSSAFKIAQSHF